MKAFTTRLVAALGAAGLAGGIYTASGLVATGSPETSAVTTSVTGCAIRFTVKGPHLHENSAHECNGASAVSVNAAGELVIKQTVGGPPVVSMTIDEDETLATRGIVAGGSGGTGTTRVRFFNTRSGQSVRADSPTLQGDFANIWVTWVHA